MILVFFFFQAEDGIRDRLVTGVQTCALPISAIVFFVSGKTGGREVVARNAEVLEYLQRIKELYAEPTPDDFVFAHRDGRFIGSFKKSFSSLIDAANVGFDGKGNRRTIYSLRHTYATFRLEEGVGVYTLARNMGTSEIGRAHV